MKMNHSYETASKVTGRPDASDLDRNARDRKYALGAVSRVDAAARNTTELRHVDSTVPLDPHDVDANDDRCLLLIAGQRSTGHSRPCSTLASRVRTQRNDHRIGNSIGPDKDLNRNEIGHHAHSEPQGASRGYPARSLVCIAAQNRLLAPCRSGCRAHQRQGQALLEMSFLIPLLVIIIGATISFGLFFFQANVMQQAVDVAAMEIARFPFKPDATLGLGDLNVDPSDTTNVLMNDPVFKQQIYDEELLVLDPSTNVNDLPLLNRLLVPLMVLDTVDGDLVRRYPGAIVSNGNGNRTVLIPIISYDNSTGAESLMQWVAPVEEIQSGAGNRPYSLSATDPATSFTAGMVALRINFPAQSTTLINRTGAEGEIIIDADDGSLSDGDTGSNYSLVIPDESGPADTTIHSGRYGLGRQAALLRTAGVRPYRKVLSTQAIYRREVFQ